MHRRPRTRRFPSVRGATISLLAGILIAPHTATAASICESGTQPDGSVVVCFLSVGTSTWRVPDGVTSIQYLVVGGGGGGGADDGGGGGAGGMLEGSATVTPGADLVVSVGKGGDGAPAVEQRGTNGDPSSIRGIATAAGGGGGGAGRVGVQTGLDGGSGGGAGGETPGALGGNPVPAGQGNRGGSSANVAESGGGGGGGAGAEGASSTTTNGADGGTGRSSSITGRSTVFAGGGGGGAGNQAGGRTNGVGGAGGGGDGGFGTAAKAGSNGLGGGGGGAGRDTGNIAVGGNGGSGIVVLRYSFAGYVIRIEPNLGTCTTTMLSGAPGSSVRLPGDEACKRDGYELVGFDFTANGSGRRSRRVQMCS
jgi:hypothetical protein